MKFPAACWRKARISPTEVELLERFLLLGVTGAQFNPLAVNKFFRNLNCMTDIDQTYYINIKKKPFGQPDEFV